MKRILLALSIISLGASIINAAELSGSDRQYLAAYEKVRAALAADDFAAAKKAADDLGDDGKTIVQAKSLADARNAFVSASDKAEKLARGQSGYFVMHCPMANKDWVQTTDKPNNPYLGKTMLDCAELKK